MKQDEILGVNYNLTFGAILDYQKLANYLLKLDFFKYNIGFIDLACGTGNLLQEIRKTNDSIPLIGIDIDDEQLDIAKKFTNDVDFINEDLFNFHLHEKYQSISWVAHLGFAFLNRTTLKEIYTILNNLYNNPNISFLIFEIWDYDYQMNNFNYNTWYKLKLPVGYLETKSVPYMENDEEINITFRFNLNNKIIESEYLMFRHKLSSIKDIALGAKWKYYSSRNASYREQAESHKVILLCR